MNSAFELGTIENATPEDLQKWSAYLASSNVHNHPSGSESIRIIRSLAINHVQSSRVTKELEKTIERLNLASDKTQKKITILTIIAVFLAFIQAIAAFITIRDYLTKDPQAPRNHIKEEINSDHNK